MKQFLMEETGTEVDISTICTFLKVSGFTRQKMVITAKPRNDALRADFLMDMTISTKTIQNYLCSLMRLALMEETL